MDVVKDETGNTSAVEIVRQAQRAGLDSHPFFTTLEERGDLGAVWALMANSEIALVRPLIRRLVDTTARVTRDDLRSLLASQLNDELGQGDYSRAHSPMFPKAVQALSIAKPANADDSWLKPGEVLCTAIDEVCRAPNPHAGLGAYIVLEVYSQQASTAVAKVVKKANLPLKEFKFVTLHEVVDLTHIDECVKMAEFVTEPADRAAAWRAAENVSIACMALLASLRGLCFS